MYQKEKRREGVTTIGIMVKQRAAALSCITLGLPRIKL